MIGYLSRVKDEVLEKNEEQVEDVVKRQTDDAVAKLQKFARHLYRAELGKLQDQLTSLTSRLTDVEGLIRKTPVVAGFAL